MNSKVLDDIKKYALARLQSEYGYAGCADSPDKVWINSDDRQGNDIKITIESIKEE